MATEEKKEETKKVEGEGKEAEKSELDPTIVALMKDPDAIANLLKTKRDSNAEAKAYRLKLEAKDKAETEAKEAALKEQGKFKELAESAQSESKKALSSFMKKLADLTIKNEAIALNSIDPDLVVLAVDRAGIKVSDDLETVEGVKEAVTALAKSKPHLFKEVGPAGTPPPGTPRAHLKGILGQPSEGSKPHEDLTYGFQKGRK